MNDGPRIAILGAGPVGLAAALEAAHRRWPFVLYEAADAPGASVRAWGHVRLFSPWSMNASSRMRERLSAEGQDVPEGDACPTGAELVATLLDPVAGLDDVRAGLRLGAPVAGVGRRGLLKQQAVGSGRDGVPFRLLVEGTGGETSEEADVVLDCTGTWSRPNWTGDGGVPAPGEREAGGAITRRLPDLAGGGAGWGGRRSLLVGAGHSAQTAAGELADLASRHPDTSVVWALRREEPAWGAVEDDPLPARTELARRASALAAGASPSVEVRTGRTVWEIRRRDDALEVTLAGPGGYAETLTVDRLLSLTGSVGDHDLYRQLQVHLCYATEGPMKLAAALMGDTSGDCLQQADHGAATLVNPEPGFFVLGSKSYGRNATFLLRSGYRQVEDVFGLLDASVGAAPAAAGAAS